MTEDEVFRFVASMEEVVAFTASEENGDPEVAWGDSFFYYEPTGVVPRRQPFATIVTKDYEGYDTVSDLGRPGVFRVNIAVGRRPFEELTADSSGEIDYTVLDRIIPHPAYASQGWVSILNPGEETAEQCRSLLIGAHALAAARHHTRSEFSGTA
ncbi:DUF6194 family protein [Actinomadura roseirufa]|uniref:DUF6194 family protein n=1 Tax=Actinomadura roseirufa TaxID=2094049 RepID=UPI001041606D|nr:DUF6194 family protein [Actinomadura roseirufa]